MAQAALHRAGLSAERKPDARQIQNPLRLARFRGVDPVEDSPLAGKRPLKW